MCGVGAMKLGAGIKEEDILFVSYQNQVGKIFCYYEQFKSMHRIYPGCFIYRFTRPPSLCVWTATCMLWLCPSEVPSPSRYVSDH